METLLSKKLRGLGKTQNEIAHDLKVSQAYIANVIKGKTLKTEAIKKFTDFYNWNFLEIFNDFETLGGQNKTIPKPLKEKETKTEMKRRVVDLEELNEIKAYIIPISKRAELLENYYSDEIIASLEQRLACILTNDAKSGIYFNIEVDGDPMSNSSDKGLNFGDWAYCKAIPKQMWRNNLPIHKWKVWCFFHNEHGIIFRHIEKYDADKGILKLSCYNPDKDKCPNLDIKIGECSYVCAVIKKISSI